MGRYRLRQTKARRARYSLNSFANRDYIRLVVTGYLTNDAVSIATCRLVCKQWSRFITFSDVHRNGANLRMCVGCGPIEDANVKLTRVEDAFDDDHLQACCWQSLTTTRYDLRRSTDFPYSKEWMRLPVRTRGRKGFICGSCEEDVWIDERRFLFDDMCNCCYYDASHSDDRV